MKNLSIALLGTIFIALSICAHGEAKKQGLYAFYPFDGTSKDSSYSANLTVDHNTNSATDRFGRLEGCRKFNGTSSYLEIPDSTNFKSQSITVALWLNAENYNTSGLLRSDIIGKDGKQRQWVMQLENSGRIRVAIFTASEEHILDSSAHISLGTWNHVCFAWNGNSITLFINGKIDSILPAKGELHEGTEPVRIGGSEKSHQFLKGAIDDLRIYNEKLTEAEINEIYSTKDMPQMYQWIYKSGVSIYAEFVEANMATVKIRKGTTLFTIPLSELAVQSVAIAKKLGNLQESIPTISSDSMSKTVSLKPGWDKGLIKGDDFISDFKHVLNHISESTDLTAKEKLTIYSKINFLDSFLSVRDFLIRDKKARILSSRNQISAAGFPAGSIYSYDFSGEFDGYSHLILAVDNADQVVAVQLLQNAPKHVILTSHSNKWSVYNFLQARKKGTSTYAIDYKVSRDQAGVVIIDSELIDANKKSREWVKLFVPVKFASLIVHILNSSMN